jgi:hypothetical protein
VDGKAREEGKFENRLIVRSEVCASEGMRAGDKGKKEDEALGWNV